MTGPSARKARKAELQKRTPERMAVYNRRAKYGLEPEDFEALLKKQGGVCAICKRPETAELYGKNKALCIDHEHTTRRVRGLLCFRCNLAIGYLGDNPDRIRAAAEYLENPVAGLPVATVHAARVAKTPRVISCLGCEALRTGRPGRPPRCSVCKGKKVEIRETLPSLLAA